MIYHILYQMGKNLKGIDFTLLKLINDLKEALLATWRNGYAGGLQILVSQFDSGRGLQK